MQGLSYAASHANSHGALASWLAGFQILHGALHAGILFAQARGYSYNVQYRHGDWRASPGAKL